MILKHYSIPLLALFVGALCALPSEAQLYNNGPYITHPNAAHTTLGTANVSQLQNQAPPTGLGDTTLGFTISPAFRLADDFSVPFNEIWTITGVHVFGYSTNFATPPSGANLRIWSGDPGAGGTIVYDGSAASTLVSANFDALRIAQSTNAGPPFTDTARRVFDTLIGVPNVALPEGQYWVDWQINPTAGAASVFGPPVTILGQGNTSANGPARQFNGTAWGVPLTDAGSGNPKDLPFIVEGTRVIIPEPSSALALILVAAGSFLSLRRR
jgi:hypothetical protein